MPGWKSLIVCDPAPPKDFVGPVRDCDFEALIELVKVLIHDLVLISTFLAVAAFVFAGYTLLTSGGNTAALTKAKGIFWKVLLGYIWILAAWLVVYTITKALLYPGYSLLGAPK